MKSSNIKSYDDLPLFLNAESIAKLLGIGKASAYELMNEKDFPTVRIGKRMIVPKDQFLNWVNEHTQGGKQ